MNKKIFLITLMIIFINCKSFNENFVKGRICNSFGFCGYIDTENLIIIDAGGKNFNLTKTAENLYMVNDDPINTIEIINQKEVYWSKYGKLILDQ
jgi:hypothetical protein